MASVLLSASVERCFVSRMQNFYDWMHHFKLFGLGASVEPGEEEGKQNIIYLELYNRVSKKKLKLKKS